MEITDWMEMDFLGQRYKMREQGRDPMRLFLEVIAKHSL